MKANEKSIINARKTVRKLAKKTTTTIIHAYCVFSFLVCLIGFGKSQARNKEGTPENMPESCVSSCFLAYFFWLIWSILLISFFSSYILYLLYLCLYFIFPLINFHLLFVHLRRNRSLSFSLCEYIALETLFLWKILVLGAQYFTWIMFRKFKMEIVLTSPDKECFQ